MGLCLGDAPGGLRWDQHGSLMWQYQEAPGAPSHCPLQVMNSQRLLSLCQGLCRSSSKARAPFSNQIPALKPLLVEKGGEG